jgi:hypothetical protein
MDKEITIKLSVLKSLPPGRILGVKNVENMDRKNVDCLIVIWQDEQDLRGHSGHKRVSYFEIDTGEYCGDTISP